MSGSGFPNAAEEAGDEPLNLHRLIVKSPASTFFMRVDNANYEPMGIRKGDTLVVDRSLEMRLGDIVVVYVSGDFGVRQVRNGSDGRYLWGGEHYQSVALTDQDAIEVWGVVSHCVHSFRSENLL